LTLEVAAKFLAGIGSSSDCVREVFVQKGTDRAWLNVSFRGRSHGEVWELLRARGLKHRRLGPLLRRCSIVTCQGRHGWDDYLLLHHFDPAVALDATSRVLRRGGAHS
jgi:hypothetical protein